MKTIINQNYVYIKQQLFMCLYNKIVEHYEEMMRQFYNTNILEKYNE